MYGCPGWTFLERFKSFGPFEVECKIIIFHFVTKITANSRLCDSTGLCLINAVFVLCPYSFQKVKYHSRWQSAGFGRLHWGKVLTITHCNCVSYHLFWRFLFLFLKILKKLPSGNSGQEWNRKYFIKYPHFFVKSRPTNVSLTSIYCQIIIIKMKII